MNQKNITTWIETTYGKWVLFGKGYRVFYNPASFYSLCDKQIIDPLFKFDDDKYRQETKIYINDADLYLTLTGDFRKEFSKCKTKEDCLQFYMLNKK